MNDDSDAFRQTKLQRDADEERAKMIERAKEEQEQREREARERREKEERDR